MDMNMYMRFHEPANRVNTECIKWDMREKLGNKDALPMWVADMDFRTADGIVEAMTKRVQHGVFGYSMHAERDDLAVVNWMQKRHNCEIKSDWVLTSPGVVDSIYHCLNATCSEGARVVIQPPVYGPFSAMTNKAGMQVIENPLVRTENGWEMDFNGLEECFKKGADAFVMCSPHNPVGRVWKYEELKNVVELCSRYGVQLISDEIHGDFELRGAKHVSVLSIPGAEKAIQLISATKTFNLAALRHSTVLCRDEEIREKIKASMSRSMADVNLFGRIATRAAYETGWEWLDALNEYLSDTRDILMEHVGRIPGLSACAPEGTYLFWLDCRQLHMEDKALYSFFTEKCGVIPNRGTDFGAAGSGYVRLNFATSHKNVIAALERIEKAVRGL